MSDETVVSVSSVLTDITANATAITTGVDIHDITKIMDKCLDVDGKNQKVTILLQECGQIAECQLSEIPHLVRPSVQLEVSDAKNELTKKRIFV